MAENINILPSEQKEYSRLSKIKNKKRYSWYLLVLFLIIVLVDMLDNITTNTNANITSCFINEFFVVGRGMDYNEGLAYHTGLSTITYIFGLITPFYKALGDKWGRKPLFIISTLGMAVGLILLYACNSYATFVLANCVTMFFLGHDMQILYVLEEAPSKYRTTIYSLIKGIGCLGSLFVPFLRETIMENKSELWRNVYILPGLAGIVFAIFVLLFVKESKVFVDERLAYLETPVEVREKQKEELEKRKTGIIPAIKYIFKDPQLRNLLIIKCVFDIAILAVQTFESIMATAGFTVAEISKAEYWFPIFYCISLFVAGILGDKIGRKKTVVIFGSITLVAFILYVVFCNQHSTPLVVGILYGLYLGGYWIGRDYMEIMATEMVPTGIRASIIGAFGLMVHTGMVIGLILTSVLPLFMPIWLSSLIITTPSVAIAIVLLLLKVKETKGVDYESIEFAD